MDLSSAQLKIYETLAMDENLPLNLLILLALPEIIIISCPSQSYQISILKDPNSAALGDKILVRVCITNL